MSARVGIRDASDAQMLELDGIEQAEHQHDVGVASAQNRKAVRAVATLR
jgi:hypothetical protein